MSHYLGIDVGTSGCRSCVIDTSARRQSGLETRLPTPVHRGPAIEQDPETWWTALAENLDQLSEQLPLSSIDAIALDGTSATLLCCDAAGTPLAPALMYNDARATREATHIDHIAPQDCAAHGASSSLAKLLWLLETPACKAARYALHQADWLLGRLSGRFGICDENNALKLGYDALGRCWPEWFSQLDIPATVLPDVVPAGQLLGTIDPTWCQRWGFSPQVRILSGTTDSTASFIATGATAGTAVTALGSTLVLKMQTQQPVSAPEFGIYSHRFGDHWLVGGASNTGGAVLQHYFTAEEIERFSARVQVDQPTGLDYYPLVAPGERFPINDPNLAPRLQPRPGDDVRFYQGILEGIASIEVSGYQKLLELGVPWPEKVITTGGGAVNAAWRNMRSSLLGVPVVAAEHQDAAFGAALLALRGRSV